LQQSVVKIAMELEANTQWVEAKIKLQSLTNLVLVVNAMMNHGDTIDMPNGKTLDTQNQFGQAHLHKALVLII